LDDTTEAGVAPPDGTPAPLDRSEQRGNHVLRIEVDVAVAWVGHEGNERQANLSKGTELCTRVAEGVLEVAVQVTTRETHDSARER
jgi:hypothetical protein